MKTRTSSSPLFIVSCTAMIAAAQLFSLLCHQARAVSPSKPVYIRVNQAGYLNEDQKLAIAFSQTPVAEKFQLVDAATGKQVFVAHARKSSAPNWGSFSHYYQLDFSSFKTSGRYYLRLAEAGATSTIFIIGAQTYAGYPDKLLEFMRQQRCGYNPFLDRVCHQLDGRTMYGPMPDSTFIDASGGWHDAGDQLKYLITASNATAIMLLAYELAPQAFGDDVDALGHPQPNGVADVLDESRWGLAWIHHLHPRPGQLYHQVADDRDHIAWKWPDRDSSDYGWGKASYRVVYFANGQPQGLRAYQSKATGVANLAGRSAAAMAIAYRIWKQIPGEAAFAEECLQAAQSLYRLGRTKEGYQQGNSYRAPYRYNEDTWADDMEWAAAELYAATQNPVVLEEAIHYAKLAGTVSWMEKDSTEHYQFYPFVNPGHFALHHHVGDDLQKLLADYYRDGIARTLERALRNPFRVGAPFIWCSNNLVVALATQISFYEQMTGDMQFHEYMLAQRDWLLGRNPWGTSMFTGLPAGGEFPEDIHTSVWYLTRKMVPGGLVDGPVSGAIYASLRGLHLSAPDEFAAFQSHEAVYHDDIGDYSSNEPTMDGTASAVYMMAYLSQNALKQKSE